MNLPRNLIKELVPQDSPPRRLLGNRVRAVGESVEDELLKRSYFWSNALMTAGFDRMISYSDVHPRVTSYSTGFVYIAAENRLERKQRIRCIEGFSYGVHILIESRNPLPQVVLPLEIENLVFPIVINFGVIEEYGIPTHPGRGTGACWIEQLTHGGHLKKGILTCRHTMKNVGVGNGVRLSPSVHHAQPTQGILADMTIATIDAAIVEIDELAWPAGLLSLPICYPVVPGQSVRFQGRQSSGQGSVLRVFEYAAYFGNLVSQRIFTDCHGQPGDSGSLFVDPVGPRGLGTHIGSVPDGAGGREGLCQHLYQASRYFNFSAFL